MTDTPAPELIAGRFEPYRVILDYEALEDGFLDRIEDLNVPFPEIDAAGGMARGETQKLLSKSRERWARTLGIVSLGKMLKGTGMALVLVVDDERFAPVKEQMAPRRRKMPPNGSIKRPAWLITKKASQNMQELRNKKLSPRQRRLIAKRAARARWKRSRTEPAAVTPVA
jgi:hypothetical protein